MLVGKDDSMKGKTVTFITMLSVLASGLWLLGLVWTMNDQFFSRPAGKTVSPISEAETEKETEGFRIVALGDSLTRGTGDQSGNGYVGYVMDELKNKADQPVILSNLAIKGQRSPQLADQLQQPEIQRQIQQADVIVMTIGGNDLFQSGKVLEDLSEEQVSTSKERYLAKLNQIFRDVRTLNQEAAVFHIGLYDPFNDLEDAKTTSKIVREWNFDSAQAAAAYEKIVSVPTYDLFELHVNEYLYSDKFHPNAEGYKLIAERVSSLITFSEEADSGE
jgi:lysophospholipase L1-like esterase